MVFPVDKYVDCIYFSWKVTYGDLPSKMAVAFKTSDTILTKEQAEHINFLHIEINNLRALRFKRNFNLTAALALLTRNTWVPEVEGNYEIIDRGFKHRHGKYYIYVFWMGKVIGYDPYCFPSREVGIYFSWKAIYGDLPSKLAVAFETSDTILMKQQVEHINFRYIEINDQHASKFKRNFT